MRALLALAILSLAALQPAPASAETTSFGHWRVVATGSVTHEWTLRSDEPCAAVGSGGVTAAMRGRSRRFRLSYFADDGYRQWDVAPPAFRVRGEITRVDRTAQNPPQADGEPCTPLRKDGCGARRLHRRAIGSVEGMVPRRRPRITFSFYDLMRAFDPRERCRHGGFNDFNLFPGAPFANYGRLVMRLPRPARIGRTPFIARVVDRRGKRTRGRVTTTVRRVSLRFVPVAARR